jgi:hypothetical protein
MKHYYDSVRSNLGLPFQGASVTITLQGTQTLATLFSDDGITQKNNPVTTNALGSFDFYVADGRYDITISGTGITTVIQSNVEISNITERTAADQLATKNFSVLASGAANLATSGAIRLGNLDIITWRNAAGTDNNALQNSSQDVLTWGNSTNVLGMRATPVIVGTGVSAASGQLRLSTSDTINWRNNANTGDIFISKLGAASGNIPADTLNLASPPGIFANFYASNSGASSVAAGGVVRLNSADSINWRQNGNNGDILLSKDSSDRFVLGSTGLILTGGRFTTSSLISNGTVTVVGGNNNNLAIPTNSGNASFIGSPASTPIITGMTAGTPGDILFLTNDLSAPSQSPVLLSLEDTNSTGSNRFRSSNFSNPVVLPYNVGSAIAIYDANRWAIVATSPSPLLTFAFLPTASNGTMYGCSDCTTASNPCTGSGTGALAVRQNGAWVCK